MERTATVSSTYRDGTCVTRAAEQIYCARYTRRLLYKDKPAAFAAILSRMRRSIAAARSIVDTSLRFDDQKRAARFSVSIEIRENSYRRMPRAQIRNKREIKVRQKAIKFQSVNDLRDVNFDFIFLQRSTAILLKN